MCHEVGVPKCLFVSTRICLLLAANFWGVHIENFTIYLNDLIWFIDNGEVCNYADDTTPYSCGNDLDVLKSNLETDCLNAINWFKDNYMRLKEYPHWYP